MIGLLLVLIGLLTAVLPVQAGAPAPNLVLHGTPKPLPDVTFRDAEGKPRSLAEFRGHVVLLNIWATWCGPCRREMPALDRLQAELGGPRFEVVALSIDRAGIDAVREFYSEIGVKNLALYIDESGRVLRDLSVVGLPVTLLISRDGAELARLIGPAEWDAPAMVTFLRNLVVSGKLGQRFRPTKWSAGAATADLSSSDG